jgi:hypothetical protein
MFVRSLDPFVTFLCVCLPIVVSNTYCAVFLFCFSSYCVPYVASFSVFLRIVYPMLPVSLFVFVLCTLCCQFLCFSSYCVLYVASFSVFLRIVYPMLPVSLFVFVLCTLCCQFLCFSSYCVPYVASFSGLFICDCHFGII